MDSMILIGPFPLEVFYDSVLVGTHHLLKPSGQMIIEKNRLGIPWRKTEMLRSLPE